MFDSTQQVVINGCQQLNIMVIVTDHLVDDLKKNSTDVFAIMV